MVFCSLFFFASVPLLTTNMGQIRCAVQLSIHFFVKISKYISRFSLVSGHVDTGTKSRTHTAMETNKKIMFCLESYKSF